MSASALDSAAVAEPVPQTMLAARAYAWHSPLRVELVPVPEVLAEEVLVRVAACGLPATAARLVSPAARGLGRPLDRPFPFIVNGDPVGRVAGLGSGCRGLSPGERVIVTSPSGCRVCAHCRADRENLCLRRFQADIQAPGLADRASPDLLLAEYATAHYRDILKLPDGVPFALASQVAPLTSPYRALKHSQLKTGESVIVAGATGSTGVRCVLLALAMGAGLVIALGRDPERLRHLKELAPARIETVVADNSSIPSDIRSVTGGLGAHRLVDYLSGASAITSAAIHALRPGGRAVLVGEGDNLELSYGYFKRHAVEVTGSSGSAFYDHHEVLELLRRGVLRLGGVELRPFPLDGVNEALTLMAERRSPRPLWCYLAFE